MASGSRIYEIFQGTPITVDTDLLFTEIGTAGTPGAKRVLTHPNGALAPITYFSNPDRTFNLDNEVIFGPLTSVQRLLAGSKVIRFEQDITDVVITEIWRAEQGSKLSMPAFFFRQLLGYIANPPAFDPNNQQFIQWEPRDKSGKVYNVVMVRLVVGGGAENNQLFDVNEVIPRGGLFDPVNPGLIAGPFDDLDVAMEGGGALDRTVLMQFKIVSEVTA